MKMDGKNIISTDDINSADNNENLTNILHKYSEDISRLKGDVKWLYKYGGVGGNGSGGSNKLKVNFTITYTNQNNITSTEKLTKGAKLFIKKGTSFKISAQITSIKSLNQYEFSVGNLKVFILATDISKSMDITPSNNSQYTAMVIGETSVSIDFHIYIDTHSITVGVYNTDGNLYEKLIEDSNSTFKVELQNLVPDIYDNYDISTIKINNTNIDFLNIEDSNKKQVTIDLNDILQPNSINNYGIYKFEVTYTFDSDSYTISREYIFNNPNYIYIDIYTKDDFTLYSAVVETEHQINTNRQQTIYYKIYGKRLDDISTASYTVDIYEGENLKKSQSCLLEQEYSYSIINTQTNEGWLSITFCNANIENLNLYRYIYFKKPDDLTYFFKRTDSGSNNYNYYGCVEYNSDNLLSNLDVIKLLSSSGEELSMNLLLVMDTSDGYYKIKEEVTVQLNKYSDNYYLNFNSCTSILLYIQNKPDTTLSGNYPDCLLSFGIKYLNLNYNDPILTIKNTGEDHIILYRNKLLLQNGISKDISIPSYDINDYNSDFHLVQFYIKANYSNDINTDPKKVFVLLIDGIFETEPIEISNLSILNLQITFHKGNWRYNHFGFATFNPNIKNKFDGSTPNLLKKYYYDFDPIIPANYYQVYKNLNDKFTEKIYESIGSDTWINFYKNKNKFISISPEAISSLTDLPVYRIIPTWTSDIPDTSPDKTNFNPFLLNTFEWAAGENVEIPQVACKFQKWNNGIFLDLIKDVLFLVAYLGSSTLHYSVKNFEISTTNWTDTEDNSLPVYFNPNTNVFRFPEQSFNLKADLVDSSHSNNTCAGAFINNYMESPFNTTNKKYNSCLVGYPCILFMGNNLELGDENDCDNIYLGIYNMALNRSSIHNLGYSTFDNLELTNGNFSEVNYYKKQKNHEETLSKFVIGEVLSNSPLYDYSLFNHGLLKNMLGDFYVYNNKTVVNEYSPAFGQAIKDFVLTMHASGILNCFNVYSFLDHIGTVRVEHKNDMYYYDDNNSLLLVDKDSTLIPQSIVSDFLNYKLIRDNFTEISNPSEQFKLVYTDTGIVYPAVKLLGVSAGERVYVLQNQSISSDTDDLKNVFDLDNVLRYYIVCMALGMVDSVQKNLTLKCTNYDASSRSTWYLGFYDMDTSFGVTNSGGKTNFRAFSDYVQDDGIIIQDYCKPNTHGWFDIPSSYLFLYAKYYGIINNITYNNNTKIMCPYNYWIDLRNNDLKNSEYFYNKYIGSYFGQIHPLLWNLNYMYKYYGASNNPNADDTELSRFNGTMTSAKKDFLKKRFRFLDALFGINNSRTIGNNTNLKIVPTDKKNEVPSTNLDIKINTSMFPGWIKGVLGTVNAKISSEPKTPIIFKLSEDDSRLIIVNDNGEASVTGSLLSNTACAFYGTEELTSLDEFGLFLNHPKNTNSIRNHLITEINITTGTSSDIEIDLEYCSSVKKINISCSNGNFNKITIKDSEKNIDLDELIINGINANEVLILTKKIKRIDITGSTIGLLTINSTTDTLSLTNNVIAKYIFLNIDLNISLLDTSTTTIKLIQCCSEIIIDCPILETLEVDLGLITKLEVKLIQALKDIQFNNRPNINTLLFGTSLNITNSSSNSYNENITLLNLYLNTEDLKLSLCGFKKLQTVLFNDDIKNILLQNNAFAFDESLLNLPNKNYIIKGSGVFYNCNSMDSDDLKCYKRVDTTNVSYMYGCSETAINSNITMLFVSDIFKDLMFEGVSNFTGMFLRLQGIESGTYDTLSEHYNTFVANFPNATTTTNMFDLTRFIVLTKTLADKIGNTYNCFLGYDNARYNYIESGSLYTKTRILNWSHSGTQRFTKIFKDGSILLEVNILNEFGSSLTTLYLFDFYMDDEIKVDFLNGLPSNVSRVYRFMFILPYINVINMENCFNNVTNSCTVDYSFTMSSSSTLKHDDAGLTNLKLFLLDDLNNFKATFLLPSLELSNIKINVEYNTLTFFKTINTNDLYTLLDTFTDNINCIFSNCEISDADSNIFEYKLGNFKLMWKSFYNLYTGDNYLNIENAFTNKLLIQNLLFTYNNTLYNVNDANVINAYSLETYPIDNGKFTINGVNFNILNDYIYYNSSKVQYLPETFSQSCINKLHSKFGIKSNSVKNMKGMFKDCKWGNVAPSGEISNQTISTMLNLYNIAVPTQISEADYLIPNDFFSICTNTATISECFCNNLNNYENTLKGIILDNDWGIKSDQTKENLITYCIVWDRPKVLKINIDADGKFTIDGKNYSINNTSGYNIYDEDGNIVSIDAAFVFTINDIKYKIKSINEINCITRIIFPSTYCTSWGGTNKYKVIIPFGEIYLFDKIDTTLFAYYGELPTYITKSDSNDYFYILINNNRNWNLHIYPNSNIFIEPNAWNKIKESIPDTIAFTLVLNSNSTIFLGLTEHYASSYKPIIHKYTTHASNNPGAYKAKLFNSIKTQFENYLI